MALGAADSNKVWSIIIVICLKECMSVTVNYYKCGETLTHYSAESICKPSVVKDIPVETYTLLQHQDEEETKGFACQEIQSVFSLSVESGLTVS